MTILDMLEQVGIGISLMQTKYDSTITQTYLCDAIKLLEKCYDPYMDMDELIDKFETVDNIPDRRDNEVYVIKKELENMEYVEPIPDWLKKIKEGE